MSGRGWAWPLLGAAAGLFWWASFVLGFLGEPSAVGNLRTGLILIGAGSVAIGLITALAAVWMLVARRT